MADPVCVNNHREYINSCQMEVLTCQDGIEKNVITEGHCPPEPCDSKGKQTRTLESIQRIDFRSGIHIIYKTYYVLINIISVV